MPLEWKSPQETPERSGIYARRVLVWVEMRSRLPDSNGGGRLAFGHRVEHPDNPPHWPRDGWFFDGQSEYYEVTAWAYADPPVQEE